MIIKNGDFKVYVHTNKINGKMYVGVTKQPLANRWKNGEGYAGCNRFYNAIKKYGWNNFDHDVFAENLTEKEALHMEQLLIEKLNLQDDNFGYNIRYGGTNCSLAEETKIKIGNALRGRVYSEEKRKMYSRARKGRKLSPEHCAAISRANKGRKRTEKELEAARLHGIKMSGDNHWTRRMGFSEESKKKISDSMKEYFAQNKPDKSALYKKVVNIDTNIVYESIEAAAKANNIIRSSISECASGKRKTAGGYHWKFV